MSGTSLPVRWCHVFPDNWNSPSNTSSANKQQEIEMSQKLTSCCGWSNNSKFNHMGGDEEPSLTLSPPVLIHTPTCCLDRLLASYSMHIWPHILELSMIAYRNKTEILNCDACKCVCQYIKHHMDRLPVPGILFLFICLPLVWSDTKHELCWMTYASYGNIKQDKGWQHVKIIFLSGSCGKNRNQEEYSRSLSFLSQQVKKP